MLEAIKATIAPNGIKGITAESLANILIEIVNAIGTGEYIDITPADPDNPECTELSAEAKAHNAEVYAKLSSVLSSGEAAPSVSINVDGLMNAKSIAPDPTGGMALYFDMMMEEVNVGVEGTLQETMESSMVFIGGNNVLLKIILDSDGSVDVVVPNLM